MNGIRWKFVIVAAILAMAISLLSGGLGGVPFGVLMVRAGIGGALFALLAAGLNLLAVRYLPELFEEEVAETGGVSGLEGADTGDEGTGRRVDIVMPAEESYAEMMAQDGLGSTSADAPANGPAGNDVGKNGGTDAGFEDTEFGEPKEPATGDLDRFSSDFDDVDEESQGSPGKTRQGPMDDHDPEEIAQAISTVMKRDKKG